MTDFNGPVGEHTRTRWTCGCDWCGQPIRVGERYNAWGSRYEGEFAYIRMHVDCYAEGYRKVNWRDWDYQWAMRENVRGLPVTQDDWSGFTEQQKDDWLGSTVEVEP